MPQFHDCTLIPPLNFVSFTSETCALRGLIIIAVDIDMLDFQHEIKFSTRRLHNFLIGHLQLWWRCNLTVFHKDINIVSPIKETWRFRFFLYWNIDELFTR